MITIPIFFITGSASLATLEGNNVGAFVGHVYNTNVIRLTNNFAVGTINYNGTAKQTEVMDSILLTSAAAATTTNLEALDFDKIWKVEDNKVVSRYYDYAGVAGQAWSGHVALSYAGGSGTEADPYKIATPEQLALLATDKATSGKYYQLTSDIIFNDTSSTDWTNTAKPWLGYYCFQGFAGTLDGAGHVISGLYTNRTDGGVGLFSAPAASNYKNLILANSFFKSQWAAAGFVANPTGALTFDGCIVEDTVTIESTGNARDAGGFVAWCSSSISISNSYSAADVKSATTNKGAFVGEFWTGSLTISNSFAVDEVFTTGNNYTATNCYGTVAETVTVTGNNTVVAKANMVGSAAMTSMPNLDWEGTFYWNDDYPTLIKTGQRIGDINGDRICNAVDVTLLRQSLLSASEIGLSDINADGISDIRDLISIKKKNNEVNDLPVGSEYTLVWADEFTGTSLDDTKWTAASTRMANTDELFQENSRRVNKVANGSLSLIACKNPYYNPDSTSSFERHEYLATNSISTEGRMSYQYGYLEIRAKVPFKEGLWPSFWLRSHNAADNGKSTGAANYDIEVDVFEVFSKTDTLSSNLFQQQWVGDTSGDSNQTNYSAENHTFTNSANLSDEYHVYGFLWTPEKMAVYVDYELNVEWEFDKLADYGLEEDASGMINNTVNILFNNHLFTNSSAYKPYAGCEIENHEDGLPAEYVIDYVRLYQNNDSGNVLITGR